jgi:hypothetical protein
MPRFAFRSIVLPLGMLLCVPAGAFEFRWQDLRVALDSELAIGAARRARDRDPDRVGLANGGRAWSTNTDDGNLAFDRGDWVSAVSRITSDLTIRAGSFGAYASGDYFYNPVIRDRELFSSANYLPNLGREFDLDERDRKHEAVRDEAGSGSSLQTAFLFGRMNLGDRPLNVRVGRQPVDWGETLLLPGGQDPLMAVDRIRQRQPGRPADSTVTPAGAFWSSFSLSRNVHLEGFYQYEWKPDVLDAAGTFWSTNDFLGAGGTRYNLGFGRAPENLIAGVMTLPSTLGVACLPVPPIPLLTEDCVPLGSTLPRVADVEPGSARQYGGAVKFNIPALNHLGLSLSAARYHSRQPLLSMTSRSLAAILPDQAGTASYFAEYPENIRNYGLGFNTALNRVDAVIHGEYSYTRNQPLAIDDTELLMAALGLASQLHPVAGATLGNRYLPGWRRHSVSQGSLGISRVFGAGLGADLIQFELEAGVAHVHDLPPPHVLRYDGPGTHLPGDAAAAAALLLPQQTDGHATATSWGYRASLRPILFNAFGALTLEPALHFHHDLRGVTPAPLSSYLQGRRQLSAGLALVHAERWSIEVGYTDYFGGGARNLLSDRDFYEIGVKTWF